MSTIKKHLWYHIGMPQINKKHLVVVAVVILLLILVGAFALSGNNAGKNTSAPAFVPPSSENTIPAGVVDSEQEEDPVFVPFVPAGECPEGQLSKEGECLPPNDEAAQVEEAQPAVAVDYTTLLYPYEEWDVYRKQVLWDNVDGHPLYSRVLEYNPGKNLLVSIGYLNNGKWEEDKRFLTTVVYGGYSAKHPELADYHGSFIKLDDPSYSGVGLIFGVWVDPIRLNPCGSGYKNNDGEVFRAYPGASLDPVVYTGD